MLRKSTIKSPCIDVCIQRDGICTGCLRTTEEVAQWESYSESQKAEVLENIKKRRPTQDYYGNPQ